MENCLANARILSKSLEATGWYTCVSDIVSNNPSCLDPFTAVSGIIVLPNSTSNTPKKGIQ